MTNKVKRNIYMIVFILSFISLMCETDNFTLQTIWMGVSFALFAISGRRLNQLLDEEEIHED